MSLRSLSIWFPAFILSGLSLLILNSVTPENVPNQAGYLIAGFGLMYLISHIDYHLYLFSPWPWYGLVVVMLTVTLLMGSTIRGSTRWIIIGPIRVQTSEMAKPILTLFLATWLAQAPPLTLKSTLYKICLAFIPAGLIFMQPDLGTALIIGSVLISALIAAGTPLKHLFLLSISCLLVIPLSYHFLHPYQKDRLSSFLNPTRDPLGTGYHAAQAMIAVGSGKIFGRGLGQGTQSHLRFLPERHTDFIFASLIEELGLVGGLLLFGAYGWLSVSLLSLARTADQDAGSLIVLMTLGMILAQTTINTGMNMGILPITGITLPFVSAGGSSILSLYALLGLCLSVARSRESRRPTLEIH